MNINIRSNPMRKWFIWAIVLIGCLPINKALTQQSGDAERNTLRIMSYNIRNGRGMDEVTDLGRIAEAIRKVAPDVVAVQEVDSVTGKKRRDRRAPDTGRTHPDVPYLRPGHRL